MTRYDIITANDEPDRDPRDWKLFGPTGALLDSRSAIEMPYGRFEAMKFDVKEEG